MKKLMGKLKYISGISVLLICLCSCSTPEQKAVRAELENRGIVFDLETMCDYIRKDNVEVVKLFLKAGMNVNKQTWQSGKNRREGDGASPLMLACYLGNMELVRLFIENKADINAFSRSGSLTPLMFASQRGHTEIVTYLLSKGADINKYNENSQTALMVASESGEPGIIKILLDAGADVNARSPSVRRGERNEKTVIMYASDYNNIQYHDNRPRDVALKAHAESIKLLTAKGADVNARRASDGRTALMIACDEGSLEMVRVLLECGADRNLRDKDGKTALMLAEKGSYNGEIISMFKK